MTSYSRSAYKNPFARTSPTSAKSRGWGNGWPNCQVGKMKTITAQDQTKGQDFDIRVTVRSEVAEMVQNLLEATDRVYDIKKSSTGAYNCRPIAGTNTASNHSWGLAVDVNWNNNPQTSVSNFHSEIPPAVVKMWNDCGWYWGGFYANSSDSMHFEYGGTPDDVKAHTARAKKFNGANSAPSTPTTPPVTPKPPVDVPVAVVVALSTVLKAAKRDPESETGKPPAGTKTMVSVVEKALVKEGYLDAQYSDGLFGSKTVDAYKKWQKELKYTGADADGLPGLVSLKELGRRHGFEAVK
jgi:hypothetical protein